MGAGTLLSPAMPSELLAYILKQPHPAPTTLIICSSRADFVASLINEVLQNADAARRKLVPVVRNNDVPVQSADYIHASYPHLVTSPLHQLVTSRHVRTLYMPTATHLRAYLSVASPLSSPSLSHAQRGGETEHGLTETVEAAAAASSGGGTTVIYGFLDLHRGTSEWSAQGLSHSSSTLVEYAHQLSLENLFLVEPAGKSGRGDHASSWHGNEDDEGGSSHHPAHRHGYGDDDGNDDDGRDDDDGDIGATTSAASHWGHDTDDVGGNAPPKQQRLAIEDVLAENVPLLSGGGSTLRKLGLDGDELGWAGRTVQVGRVLKRWFRFQTANWEDAEPSGRSRE
ncbi:hypothetical protein MN608_05299 [Microdochium nivale]|nr:hypothetical protein MN608_05299 [Microdochium nivale]